MPTTLLLAHPDLKTQRHLWDLSAWKTDHLVFSVACRFLRISGYRPLSLWPWKMAVFCMIYVTEIYRFMAKTHSDFLSCIFFSLPNSQTPDPHFSTVHCSLMKIFTGCLNSICNVSSVVEFQRWWVLKLFAQESTCSKEILISTSLNHLWFLVDGVIKVDYLYFPWEKIEILCELDVGVIACNF